MIASKNNKVLKWLYSSPRIIGFLAFLITLSFLGFMVSLRYKIIKENQQKEMANILSVVQQNFHQILKTSYTATLTLAMTIKDDGKTENFNTVAKKLIDNGSGIDAVQLVPNGIIKYVYPLEPNRAALNYNILKSKYNIRKEAEKSIQRKEIYFAGPIKLIQGGTAIVGRLPVFKNSEFWGFSAVVIKLETFLKSSGVNSMDTSKYYFQLSKKSLVDNKEEFFLPNKSLIKNKYYQTVNIKEGDWKLYLISTKKNTVTGEILTLLLFGFLLSVVTGLLITYLLKRPIELKKIIQKKSKELLITAKEYQALFDQAPIGIAKLDSLTGNYLEINKEYSTILGYTEDEIREFNFKSIVHEDDLDRFLHHMNQLLNEEISEFALTKKVYHKSGKIIIINLHIAAIWKNGEKMKTHMTIIEDITDKKIAEENLKKSFNVVTEQNKRLLNFSYIISHNLRSHTSNIQTIADLLEDTKDEEERVQMIGLLKKVSKSLNETMHNLNEVVSIRTNVDLVLEPLNLKDYVTKCLCLLQDKIIESNVEINNLVPANTIVNYSIAYLESVLYNFISNAIRYRDEKKKPTVTISFDKETQLLKIADNGLGIDLKRNGEKLFGLYKVFNEHPESKGVGLFIAKNQIEAMEGAVFVESELHLGTTFSIYFK